MKVLIVGQGGREHALAQALHESASKPALFVWPGNDGMGTLAQRVAAGSLDELIAWMQREGIDLCVAGEEKYLVLGLADKARAVGIRTWGPVAASAQLEASKRFAKEFMVRHGVPTAHYTLASSPEAVRAAISSYPTVLKYDGLAAGKGVAVCLDAEMVEDFIDAVYVDRKFGDGEVLVEECMTGKELSVICAVADGDYLYFTPARDYKRQLADDAGPNTGGMGAVASRAFIDEALMQRIRREIIEPTVKGLVKDGLDYRGFLYFGLMLTPTGPRVLEFNVRFGDPEAQAILPLVSGDFATFLYEAANGSIQPSLLQFSEGWSICVVQASRDYPRASGHGEVIHGLDDVTEGRVYHAGTLRGGDGQFIVNGGRVLAVACAGATREEALDKVYRENAKISFDGAQFRPDIGRMHFE